MTIAPSRREIVPFHHVVTPRHLPDGEAKNDLFDRDQVGDNDVVGLLDVQQGESRNRHLQQVRSRRVRKWREGIAK